MEAAIAQEYDAIATIAGDAGVAPYIDKAVDAGIPVATFNSETAAPNKRLFFVGADLYKQGEAAGKAMADAIGGKGKVGIITGFFAVEAHELRRKGFEDYLKANNPEIEIVGEVENTDKGDIAYTQAQDFMTANPDLAGIYVTAGGPFGAAAAVEDAGKTGAGQGHLLRLRGRDDGVRARRASSPPPSARGRLPRAMTRPSACSTTWSPAKRRSAAAC